MWHLTVKVEQVTVMLNRTHSSPSFSILDFKATKFDTKVQMYIPYTTGPLFLRSPARDNTTFSSSHKWSEERGTGRTAVYRGSG